MDRLDLNFNKYFYISPITEQNAELPLAAFSINCNVHFIFAYFLNLLKKFVEF